MRRGKGGEESWKRRERRKKQEARRQSTIGKVPEQAEQSRGAKPSEATGTVVSGQFTVVSLPLHRLSGVAPRLPAVQTHLPRVLWLLAECPTARPTAKRRDEQIFCLVFPPVNGRSDAHSGGFVSSAASASLRFASSRCAGFISHRSPAFRHIAPQSSRRTNCSGCVRLLSR